MYWVKKTAKSSAGSFPDRQDLQRGMYLLLLQVPFWRYKLIVLCSWSWQKLSCQVCLKIKSVQFCYCFRNKTAAPGNERFAMQVLLCFLTKGFLFFWNCFRKRSLGMWGSVFFLGKVWNTSGKKFLLCEEGFHRFECDILIQDWYSPTVQLVPNSGVGCSDGIVTAEIFIPNSQWLSAELF